MRLSDARIMRVAQGVGGIDALRWLAEGVAADLCFNAPIEAVRAALTAALAGEPVDTIVQSAVDREKRLLVADIDSTLIGQECVDELAAYVGAGAKVAEITDRAMRGEIAFEPALRERVELLAGLPESVIGEVLRDRITLNPGARTLVRTMRARGAAVAIVSGGFRQFTGAIRARLGADEDRANVLAIQGGKLTGKVIEPILGHDAKLGALKEIAAQRGLALSQTLAVGDGANDLAMLKAAGLGVAYRAKPKVAASADARITTPTSPRFSTRRGLRAGSSSRGEGGARHREEPAGRRGDPGGHQRRLPHPNREPFCRLANSSIVSTHETPLRLHHGESAQWHALRRRNLPPRAPRRRASDWSCRGLYQAIWLQTVGLARAARTNGRGNREGKANQVRKPKDKLDLIERDNPLWKDRYENLKF